MEQKRSLGCAHRFRPTYAQANVGHPSDSLRPCYDTDGTQDLKSVPQRLKPSIADTFTARLKPCPSYGDFFRSRQSSRLRAVESQAPLPVGLSQQAQ